MMEIMLCCNHHENGMFAGKLYEIQFRDSDGEMTLSCVDREPKSDFETGLIRISRRLFPIQSHTEWVGNWCWDHITTDDATGMEIFNYIVSLKKFSPESAEGEIWNERWETVRMEE